MDKGDGSYAVSYTPVQPGLYSVWVCVKARHVKVRRENKGTLRLLLSPDKSEGKPVLVCSALWDNPFLVPLVQTDALFRNSKSFKASVLAGRGTDFRWEAVNRGLNIQNSIFIYVFLMMMRKYVILV